MCTQQQAIQILKEVYEECNPVLEHRICDAYLYGSYARGDYHAQSDIDILLTVHATAAQLALYRSALAVVSSQLSLKHDITISITVKPIEQFLQYANVLPYYQNVRKEGILYAG